jgi:general secretion pathway protein J
MLHYQRRPKLCPAGGFTLLELLLSVAILSLIVMILGGAFRLVVRSWERGEGAVEEFRKTRMVLDRISAQIKSIYPYRIKKDGKWMLALQGRSHVFQFVSPLSIQSPLISGLVWVRYSLQDEGARGKNFLVQEWMVPGNNFFPGSADELAQKGVTMVLLSGVDDVTFEYLLLPDDAPKAEWRTRWECEEGENTSFPQAIRVTLKQRAKNSQEEPVVTAMTVPLIALPDKDFAQRGETALLSPPGESSPGAQK